MKTRSPFWQFSTLVLVISLVFPLAAVRAQGTTGAVLFPPDITAYPTITALLDVFNDQGNFVTGLTPADVDVLEDGQQVTPTSLETLQPPLDFVLAINSGPALAVRDGLGFSRYTKMAAVLSNWAAARPADQDNLALVWNGGIIASGLTSADWKTRFEGFDPVLRNSTPGLTALAFALDIAQQTPSAPGSKKAIFLLTPHLESRDLNNLPELESRAKQANVRVFVWLSDSKDYLTHPGALALQDLAAQTGGRYLTFTGSETLPDPEEWLAPLRYVYRLTYESSIRAGGTHTVSVQVNAGDLALTSNPQSFPLDIQPPKATLLSPPIQIVRQNPDDPFNFDAFLPASQQISALIEFPDQFNRSFTRTSLYVDGQMVDENTEPPFDRFTWDLTGYVATSEHVLQVEVQDALGLSSLSTAVPVQVTVVQPPGGIAGLVLRNRVAVTVAVLVLAGAVLLGVIFFGGRRTLSILAERRQARARNLDPVTQPVHAPVETASAARPSPFPWLRRKTPAPSAYFVKLTPDEQPAPGDPIPLLGHELTFGTDPTQATNVLDHPSVSPLHARLRHDDNGSFLLMDQNSTAGTWINYESIPKEGRMLTHGDVIHFGTLTYRFVLAKPPAARKPTIAPLTDG